MPSKLFSPEMNSTIDFIPSSWPTDDIITLRVGNVPTLFHVHKSLLIHNSPFFKNALTHDWKEAKGGVVDLPEDSIEVMQSWVLWLYQKHLFTPAPSDNNKNDSVLQPFLCQCYAFGDKIQDKDFKDTIIDAYILRCRKLGATSFGMIRTTYEHTTRRSRARRLHVDLAMSPKFWDRKLFEPEKLRKILKDLPEDFQVDLIAALGAGRGRETDELEERLLEDMCAYHEHGIDGRCYQDKRP